MASIGGSSKRIKASRILLGNPSPQTKKGTIGPLDSSTKRPLKGAGFKLAGRRLRHLSRCHITNLGPPPRGAIIGQAAQSRKPSKRRKCPRRGFFTPANDEGRITAPLTCVDLKALKPYQ